MRLAPEILWAFLVLAASAQPAAAAKAAKAPPTPQQKVSALVAAYEKQIRAKVGVSAVEIPGGRTLVAIRSNEAFAPASNQKALTAVFALLRLGGNCRLQTTLYRLKDGTVLLRGNFDPTLGDGRLAEALGRSRYAELDRWAVAIKAAGTGKAPPAILLVDNPDPRTYRHGDWPKAQHQRWYCAPVARLNFNNNCFDVKFRLQEGHAAVQIFPYSRFYQVVNKVKAGRRHAWWLATGTDDALLTFRGTVNQTMPDALSVAANSPPLLLGRALAERLVRVGVKFNGPIRVVAPEADDRKSAAPICRTSSPLSLALGQSNKHSLNMAAECLFLCAGDGTWAGSARRMDVTLSEAYGLQAEELVVRDGGGLSHGNRVSPTAMTKILRGVLRRPDAAVLLRSLPISGTDGGLARRLGGACRGRVLGKTGWIRGASGLTGYVLDASGRPKITYSVLVADVPGGTNWRAKKLQDDICRALVANLDGPPQKQKAAGKDSRSARTQKPQP